MSARAALSRKVMGSTDPSRDDWISLTKIPKKPAIYARDSYFREGWRDITHCLGARGLEILGRIGLCVLKPEAVSGRRIAQVIKTLQKDGVVIAFASISEFGTHEVHAAWRYQLNLATPDRLHLMCSVRPPTKTLALVLIDPSPSVRPPLSVKLKRLKGSPHPSERTSASLREILRSDTPLINFVHTADEPADVVRELAIWLPIGVRRKALLASRNACAVAPADLHSMIGHLYGQSSEHDLSLERSWERITLELQANGSLDSPQLKNSAARISAAVAKRYRVQLHEIMALADRLPVSFATDVFVVSAHLIELDRDDETAELAGDVWALWQEHRPLG
jgi:nucleoside diphosphate kinase